MATASPALSCKKIYPTFVRTIPPEHQQNKGRVSIVKHFGWGTVGVLREDLDTYRGMANALVETLRKTRVQITTSENLSKDPSIQIDNLKVPNFSTSVPGLFLGKSLGARLPEFS